MKPDSTCLARHPATPEYVLEVIRDEYRQQLQFDPEAEPGVELKFETTVSEWRATCDLVAWKPLGKALGVKWDFAATDGEWKHVLEPAEQKRLVDVCNFIASRATRSEILPSRLLGTTCHRGGTFLAIRAMLAESGADVHALRPSSPITPYINKYPDVFLGPISRLAPNVLPLIKVHNSSLKLGLYSISYGGLILSFVFSSFSIFLLSVASVVTLLPIVFLPFVSVRCEFPGIVTFRDLVEIVCAEDARPTHHSSETRDGH